MRSVQVKEAYPVSVCIADASKPWALPHVLLTLSHQRYQRQQQRLNDAQGQCEVTAKTTSLPLQVRRTEQVTKSDILQPGSQEAGMPADAALGRGPSATSPVPAEQRSATAFAAPPQPASAATTARLAASERAPRAAGRVTGQQTPPQQQESTSPPNPPVPAPGIRRYCVRACQRELQQKSRA